jgi:hypothetical protein
VARAGERSAIARLLSDVGFAHAAAESVQALATPSRLRMLAHVPDLLDEVVSHVEHVHLGLPGRERTAEPANA